MENYLIIGNCGNCKSFLIKKKNKFNLYRKYLYPENIYECFISLDVYESESNNEYKLISPGKYENVICIWDFDSSELVKRIKINFDINDICFWNEKYIFVGCADKEIKLVDIEKDSIIKSLKRHKEEVLSVRKIRHPFYGECLLSQGSNNDGIILWTH